MTVDKKYLYLFVGIILGGLAIGVILSANSNLISKKTSISNSTEKSSDNLDAHFIEQMIPHHEDAISMSELALEKSTKPEVRELAQNIIVAQASEIKEMKIWYKDWFGRDLPSDNSVMSQHGMMGSAGQNSMHMGMMGSDADLESLKDAEDFDKAYVEDMIPHHQMAVMMANMLKDGTKRPEMKKLADNIITSQTSEIEMMRKWLQDWK